MRKKNIIGFLLAFVMLFSICTNSFVVFAEESGDAKEPALENKVANAEVMDEEKEIDAEKPEDPQEEIVKEPVEPEKKVEKVQKLEKAEELKAQDSEDAIDLGEENIPEAVAAPEAFDLKKINTLAKDAEGNCYAVKDYGDTYDNVLTKYFYKIDENDYNALSQNFLMTFKRKDGQPFKVYDSKISTGDIKEQRPTSSVGDAIFTELKLRDHMVYESTIVGNFSPARRVQEQKDVDWYIELNKDWVIKTTPGFTDGKTKARTIFLNYNVEVNGNGHKVYRKDEDINYPEVFCIGVGNGDRSEIILNNLIVDGSNKYMGAEVYQNTKLDLKKVQFINGFTNQSNFGGAMRVQDKCEVSTDSETVFEDCKANWGGAIRLLGNCSLTINGSKFLNNQADLGGAICSLDEDSTINVNGAIFDGNKAVETIDNKYLQGGAIYTNSPLNITGENNIFKNNTSKNNGGAITSHATTTINECDFTKNSSTAGNGGAIASFANTTIKGCNFSNNSATAENGGAIYQSKNSELNITGSTFTENGCNKQGGAVFINTSTDKKTQAKIGVKAKIEGTKFIKNGSNGGGGAIYINWENPYETEVKKCEFQENGSHFGGGIYVNVRSKLKVEDSKFVKNQAGYGAGISSGTYTAWLNDMCKLTINKSNFEENHALMGGGVYTAFPTEITNTTFTKNQVLIAENDDKTNPHNSGVGGAMEIIDSKTTIKASTFEENVAQGSGGAIGINGVARNKAKNITEIKPNIKVEISEGTQFIKNTCGIGQGGAIFTIPYLYDIEGYEVDVPEATLKEKAYKNLSTSADTIFKDNVALTGFVDPPTNYKDYTDLKFKTNSFTDMLSDKDLAKSLLNNYDVNYMNKKLSASFDPNGGEFKDGEKPKDIRVVNGEKDKEIKLLAAPKKDGYKFTGWKLSMNIPKDKLKEIPEETLKLLKEGKIFKAGDNFKLDADYIFVAQWEKDDTPASPSKPEPKPETKPEPEPEIKFKKHEYVETFPVITKLAEKDNIYSHIRYLFGYPDDTIKPEGNMTRAEAVAVVTRLEGYSFKDESEKIFKDLKKGAWYNKYINAAFEKGILVEKEGQAFRPDEAITRAEFAKLISFIDADNSKIAPFPDVKGHVYEDAINKAYGNDRIKGYPDGSFRPDAKITRAEIVTILNNFYDRKADDKSLENVENIKMLKHFKDLKEDYWAYYEITEAANSHKFTRRSKGLAENWVHLIEDLEK